MRLAQMDGDLSAVVRAGTGGTNVTAGESSKISLLGMIDMDTPQNTNKLAVESGSCGFPSGSSSPSSVLQCASSVLLQEKSKCRGEETLADVCLQSFTYRKGTAPPSRASSSSTFYYSSSAGRTMDSPRNSYNNFSSKKDASSIVERIPEVLSRNLQRRDHQQLSHAAPGVHQMQRKETRWRALEATADMHAVNRTRLRSRAMGSGLMDGGRPGGPVSQDNIKEDFFQGGSNSATFSQRTATSQSGVESASSEHACSSRQSSPGPGRDEPTHVTPIGPVKKIEHSVNVKIEESSADDQFSPGGSKAPKRRKNQQKRIVCVPVAASGRPTSEGLPSDLWAWRKYGQKPIKGSPYPRGYYRCSSSKGCSARKQVERSRTDPTMLIITYTAEHNHPWPSHRNALAGSSRMSSLEKGGSTVAQGLEKAEETGAAGQAMDAGATASAANSPLNSPDCDGAGEESELVSVMSTTAMLVEDQVADNTEPFAFGSEKDPIQEIMGHHGSLHLSSRSSISIQDDDFFAELGELPDSNFVFGTRNGLVGLIEDRSDDESGQLGMDNVDPYNLFNWSSGPCLQGNVVI